ncbi:MAG: oligosaccharide flippase family protein [Ferruginibacter sp.]
MTVATLFNKLRNKHFLSLAGNGSMAVLGVVTYAILYRLLPETAMGNWIFFQTVFALLDAVRTGFLQTALIKFYSGADEQRQKIVAGSTWYIAIVITLLLALPNLVVLYSTGTINDTGVLFFLQWYGITLLLSCPYNVSFWILQAEQRFDRILILRVVNQGSFIACLVGIYFFGEITIQLVIYFYLGCTLFTSFIPLFLGWSHIATITKRTSVCVKEIYRFGRYSMGTYLCSTVFKYSDSIIIKFMIGPAALAVYNLAQRLLEVIEIPIRSFLATAMPAMSVEFNKHQQGNVAGIMKKYTGTLIVLLVPVIVSMILFADIIVGIIGGQKYIHTEAANVFRIFMLSAILFPLDRFTGITLDIINRPQLNFIKIILSLIVNVATDIIAIKMFGNIYGVAAASIITILFGVVFGYFSLNRYLSFNLSGILKSGYYESKNLVVGFMKRKSIV